MVGDNIYGFSGVEIVELEQVCRYHYMHRYCRYCSGGTVMIVAVVLVRRECNDISGA